MYLLYEHFKAPNGELLATDMLMSSFFPGTPGINFRSASEKAFFEFTKKVFKDVHIKQRSYDPETNVWSFFPPSGAEVYASLKNSALGRLGLIFEKIENLKGQKLNGYIRCPTLGQIDPADFFYTPEPPKSTSLSKEELSLKLSALLMLPPTDIEVAPLSALKRPYRQAALRLHPDRNNGDGSQMSELNMLWQQWQPFAASE